MMLYHVTKAGRVPSIRASGLVLGSAPLAGLFGTAAADPTALWFFGSRQDALEFIGSEEGCALLHFDIPRAAVVQWEGYDAGERWYYTLAPVSPKQLRKVEIV